MHPVTKLGKGRVGPLRRVEGTRDGKAGDGEKEKDVAKYGESVKLEVRTVWTDEPFACQLTQTEVSP